MVVRLNGNTAPLLDYRATVKCLVRGLPGDVMEGDAAEQWPASRRRRHVRGWDSGPPMVRHQLLSPRLSN